MQKDPRLLPEPGIFLHPFYSRVTTGMTMGLRLVFLKR